MNQHEAPAGFIAARPNPNRRPCAGCFFDDHHADNGECEMCRAENRTDQTDVIFEPE